MDKLLKNGKTFEEYSDEAMLKIEDTYSNEINDMFNKYCKEEKYTKEDIEEIIKAGIATSLAAYSMVLELNGGYTEEEIDDGIKKILSED